MQPQYTIAGLLGFVAAEKEGLLRAPAPVPATFNVVLDAALQKYLPEDQYFGTIYRLQKYFTALHHLRGDNHNMYLQLYNEAEALREPECHRANAILESFGGAAAAFEKYRYEDYGAALELNRKSFGIDDELENKGLDFFYCHKIQLMHNLAKILDRQKNPASLSLLQGLLRLLACKDDLHFNDFRISRRELPEFDGILNTFFIQISNEALGFYTRLRKSDARAYNEAIAVHIEILSGATAPSIALKAELQLFAEILGVVAGAATAEAMLNAQPGITRFLGFDNPALLAHKGFLLAHYRQHLEAFDNVGAGQLGEALAGIPGFRNYLS